MQMSDLKGKRESVKKMAATKSQWTKQKPKIGEYLKAEPELTVTKNLLKEFNAAEMHRSSNKKENAQQQQKSVDISEKQSDHSVISQLNDTSSVSQSAILSNNEPQIFVSSEFQLPRSYILAMRGLQQGIDVRQRDIKKIKKTLREQISTNEQQKSLNEQLSAEKEELLNRLNDLTHENKFLKEMIADLKTQAESQLKLKIELENALRGWQEKSQKQNQEITKIGREEQALKRQKATLKEQLHQISRYMNERKAEYEETTRKKTEEYAILFAEISSLRSQLSKQRQQHQKDVAEISALKADIRSLLQTKNIEQDLFKQQLVLAEKHQLDKLEYEVSANRQILKDLSFNQQANAKPAYQEEVPQTAQKHQSQRNDSDLRSREQHTSTLDYRPSIEKRTPITRIQRSTSRLRQTNDSEHPQRRELISQMRELMRYQKELVSLNYQIQMLEKGMACQSGGARREEMQKTYSKLRKNIQRKQAEVRQLKHFLDNPMRSK